MTVETDAAGSGARIHVLRTWSDFWRAVDSGAKSFEVRRDDRGFAIGDVLILRECLPIPPHHIVLDKGKPNDLTRVVTYVLTGGQFGIEPGYVVLGLAAPATPTGPKDGEPM